jgi:Transposase DDE domain
VRSDRREDMDHYRNLTACPACPLKPRCTPDKVKRVKRWEHEGVLDKMQARLNRLPEAMVIRRLTVEHVFGTFKAWMGMGSCHFLTKTLKNVRTEMSLQVLAYNMKRMINMFGDGQVTVVKMTVVVEEVAKLGASMAFLPPGDLHKRAGPVEVTKERPCHRAYGPVELGIVGNDERCASNEGFDFGGVSCMSRDFSVGDDGDVSRDRLAGLLELVEGNEHAADFAAPPRSGAV